MPFLADALDAIEVRSSGIHGRGVFATRRIAAGRPIARYDGRRYAPGEQRDGGWDAGPTYLFGLSDGATIDGADGGNATRFINHACEPNCVACEVEDDDGRLGIVIEALRAIDPGEELFLDYGLDLGDDDPADHPCRCGRPLCRGTLAAPLEAA